MRIVLSLCLITAAALPSSAKHAPKSINLGLRRGQAGHTTPEWRIDR